jgi:carboxyl-terminal processing protease
MKRFAWRSANGLAWKLSALAAILVVGTTAALTAPRSGGGPVLSCPALDKIEQVFLSQHVIYGESSEALEARAIEQYIKRIDGAKIYLLEGDVATIKKEMKGLFGSLRRGDCGAIDRVQKLFESRISERVEFAKKTLSNKKYKLDPKTELVLDPDTRKFAKNKAAADAFQAKYLQFQLSNSLATGITQEEAQGQVIRNYERALKKIKETTQAELFSGYLDSFGRALDPHSSYFSPETLEDFQISMGLSLEGIGASLSSQDGFTIIEQLIEGGSAKASGVLQPQDKIIAVGKFNDKGDVAMESVVEQELNEVVRKIRGPKGSKVRLQILRKKDDGSIERFLVDLVRDKVKLEEDAAQLSMLEKEVNGGKKTIAVLNLPSFYADEKRGGRTAAGDMRRLLREAKEKGAEALVLDLSNNGGGSLDDAVKIAGLFFKTGNVVKQSARANAFDGEGQTILADRDPGVEWEGPMVVLTSRISASASEIVAGTLKDYKRAVVVGGDHTFGKGSVQSVVPLPVGLGAVKVTVGMFFTPGGFSTQHRGVEADIVLPGAFSTEEIGEKHLDYSLSPQQLAPFLSQEAYVASGVGAWKLVDQGMVAQMKARSKIRVVKNSDFQKIIDEQKKNAQKGKVIKLGEALKETKEKKVEADQKKKQTKEEKVAEYLKRADIQEAANVVADLMALQSGMVLTETASVKPADTEKKTR